MDIRQQLLAAVDQSRHSERKLSVLATGSTDTLRNMKRGAVPRLDTLEALCRVLGLQLSIGPGLVPPDEAGVPVPGPPTQFSESWELPVYEWAGPSEEGYVREKGESARAPAPVDLPDEQAFYVRMPDHSMVPARIWKNDLCLVSPCAELRVDQRVWVRGPTGRETIRWLMRLPAGGYDLAAWDLDERGHQKPIAVHWARDDVVDRGTVLAVYREKPVVTKRLRPVADWGPDALTELWRSAMFSKEFKSLAAKLDEAVAAVEDAETQIKCDSAEGKISVVQGEQLLTVLNHRLQGSLESMRSSIENMRSSVAAVGADG